MTHTMTNIVVKVPEAGVENTYDEIFDAVKTFSHKALLQLHGRCCSKYYKHRTPFEATFLRVYKDILLMRELNNRNTPKIFNAFEPPIPIVPLEMLTNLTEHQGTRFSEVSQTTETCNLQDLYIKPLMHESGILILGSPVTTGVSKSPFALRLAVEWCKAYHEAIGCPKEDCCVVFTNTLDVARGIVFKRSYWWIVDEMMPADGTQTIYMSENVMKAFLTPLAPAKIRRRNSDLVLPPGMPRIITANATSAEEWCCFRC
jgi:hypothetical protein